MKQKLNTRKATPTQIHSNPQVEPYPDMRAETREQRALVAGIDEAVQRMSLDGEEGVVQLKSAFTNLSFQNGSHTTPIAALSDSLGKYYTQAGLPESYNFHHLQHQTPGAYGNNFKRAHIAEATIDHTSYGGDRDGTIIGPYGKFGVMERAILGRQNRGDTSYDGGHLIEHSLMSGQDADVHGNLAPQEGKHFNQSMMRGWESIPEKYAHSEHLDFTYKVEVKYPDGGYTTTGKQMRELGIVPPNIYTALPDAGPKSKSSFDAEDIKIPRWIPDEWIPTLSNYDGGKKFPSLDLNYGAQMANFYGDETAAEAVHHLPGSLKRQKSGVLSGTIDGLGKTSDTTATVGGSASISAHMFSSFPFAGQQDATNPWGDPAGAVIPPAPPANILSKPLSALALLTELRKVQVTKKAAKAGKKMTAKPGKVSNLTQGTIIRKLKETVPAKYIAILLSIVKNNSELAKFVSRAAKSFPGASSKTDLQNIINESSMSVTAKRAMLRLMTDNNLRD